MPIDTNLLDRLRSRGEEVFTQVSAELMSNPSFMRAMEGALRGKEKVDATAAQAIKSMNIPTRTEFKRALKRIDALEHEVADLRLKLKKARAAAKAGKQAKTKTSPAKRPVTKAKKTKTAG